MNLVHNHLPSTKNYEYSTPTTTDDQGRPGDDQGDDRGRLLTGGGPQGTTGDDQYTIISPVQIIMNPVHNYLPSTNNYESSTQLSPQYK